VSGVLGRMGLWASYGWMVAIRPTSQQYRPERSIASPITPQIRGDDEAPSDDYGLALVRDSRSARALIPFSILRSIAKSPNSIRTRLSDASRSASQR
jgi:hypothetical protein